MARLALLVLFVHLVLVASAGPCDTVECVLYGHRQAIRLQRNQPFRPVNKKRRTEYDFVRFGRSAPSQPAAKKASYDYIRFGKRALPPVLPTE